MSEEDEVHDLIRSVIMSKKGGVLLQDLNSDYMSLAGQHIPYAKLGCKCLEELLENISEISKSSQNGQILYTSTGKNCDHLVELISNQKLSKTVKPKYKPKIYHFKTEETFPKCNDYSYKFQPKKVNPRSARSKPNPDSYESGHEVNKSKESGDKFHPPTLSDTKHRDSKNFRGRSGLGINGLSRSEEEIYAQNHRQREYRNGKTVGIQWSSDWFRQEEGIPPLIVQDPRYDRMDQFQNFYKFYRFKEAHPHHHFVEKHSKYQDLQNSRQRYMSNELDCYDRERFLSQRCHSPHNYECERRHNWVDGGIKEHYRHMQDNSSRYTDRKIDLVSGSLRVTIKNF